MCILSFEIFLPSNFGRINLYLPDIIALEMGLLFREVCLVLSFTPIKNITKSTSAMFPFFSWPVQTCHHPVP